MEHVQRTLATLKMLALYKFPYSGEFGTVNRSVLGCLGAADRNKVKRMPWLQDIVFTILTTFGGALVAPVIVGEPPVIFVNELLLPVFLTVWLLVVQWGGGDNVLTRVLRNTWVKRILLTAASASTANSVCGLVDKGAKKFTKGSLLYPTALFGPWLVGVIRGSAAAFLPGDKGLKALDGGVPYSMQLAAFAAAVYHVAANDSYVLGGILRGMLAPIVSFVAAIAGSGDGEGKGDASVVTPLAVRLVIVALYVSMTFVRTFDSYKDFNCFTPAHRLLYAVTGVPPSGAGAPANGAAPTNAQKKAAELAKKKQSTFDLARNGAAAAVLLAFIVSRLLPPDSLPVGGELRPGGMYLGTCTLLPELRGCTPYVATVGADGSLQVLRARRPNDPSKVVAWSSPAPRKEPGESYATLQEDGRLAVVGGGKALWQSGVAGSALRPPGAPYHVVLRSDGTLAVVEGGEDVWASTA